MTAQPTPQPSFSGDHRSPARARWKTSPVVLPLHPSSENAAPKVSLKNISLSYKTNDGSRLLALDDISLNVKPGEFVCVVGPSGCGKSTLLHLIAGLQPPTSGQ